MAAKGWPKIVHQKSLQIPNELICSSQQSFKLARTTKVLTIIYVLPYFYTNRKNWRMHGFPASFSNLRSWKMTSIQFMLFSWLFARIFILDILFSIYISLSACWIFYSYIYIYMNENYGNMIRSQILQSGADRLPLNGVSDWKQSSDNLIWESF